MLKIGLTGGIGSGKSTVAKVFEVLGIPVYYADDAAKKLMNTNAALRQEITAAFGPDSYVNGILNRKYIASLVFSNPEKLALLNSITHPATIAHAQNWIAQQTAPYIIKEAALLFESGSYQGLDFIIGVSAPLAFRIKRTADRDLISTAEVELRIKRQMDEEEKMKRCDFIIVNDETVPIIPQILELDLKFRQPLTP